MTFTFRTGTPDLESLRRAVAAFDGTAGTPPEFDLSAPEDRRALLKLLNAWGCRIRYPRSGETDLFDAGVLAWATRWIGTLPDRGVPLAELQDTHLATLGDCYAELSAISVGSPDRPRTLGPTAASKMLHMLRPYGLMPWDETIAQCLHGGRDAVAYVAHQRLGREWAAALLAETGLDEETLTASLGGPGRPLAKVLDDHCYIRYTRRESW